MIVFHIPGYLRPFTGHRRSVDIPPGPRTVGEALDALGAQFPGVRERVLVETGEVRQHVNVFVGQESIRYTGGLATPVRDGAEISILPAVSGGAPAQTVIFACVHNAGRSQMAAAFFNALADASKAVAISAGTHPAERVHPEVLTAMKEVGADLSAAVPKRLTADLARTASLLVTMGCGEECPLVPGVPVLDWLLLDPKGKGADVVRAIRDEVEKRVRALLAERTWTRRA